MNDKIGWTIIFGDEDGYIRLVKSNTNEIRAVGRLINEVADDQEWCFLAMIRGHHDVVCNPEGIAEEDKHKITDFWSLLD